MNEIAFTPAQREATRQAEALLSASPRARKLMEAELQYLSDPDGPVTIQADPEELNALYQGAGHMHAVLTLLGRLPWLREAYRAHGIDETVLRATLQDLPLWMGVCRNLTGRYGLIEYDWLCRHFRFKLFRLGRLQFMAAPGVMPARVYRNRRGETEALAPDGNCYTPGGEADGTNGRFHPDAWAARLWKEDAAIFGHRIVSGRAEPALTKLPLAEWRPVYAPGEPVLEVHIPAGEPLLPGAALESLAEAPRFFARHFGGCAAKLFTCESWIMDEALRTMLPEGNLLAFQRLFELVPFASSDRQMIDRVFGFSAPGVFLPENPTRLQRAIHRWYQRSGLCKEAYGYRLVLPE
jgi:hypothetical protein